MSLDLRLGSSEHTHVLPISVFVAVLCLCILIGHLIEEYKYVNESSAAILIVTTLTLALTLLVACEVSEDVGLISQKYNYNKKKSLFYIDSFRGIDSIRFYLRKHCRKLGLFCK